jgi:hypothetical protein
MKWAALLSAFLLGGCAIAGKGVATNLESVPPSKGVVVFSTSADELSASFAWRLMLVEGESRKKYDKVVIFLNAKLAAAPTFAEQNSVVRTLTLPPGDYYFVPVPVNPALDLVRTPVYRFSVVAGAVEYIGTVHLEQQRLTVEQSHFDRDVEFFKQKNPTLRDVKVQASTMAVDRYLSRESGAGFEIKGIIWDAPQ